MHAIKELLSGIFHQTQTPEKKLRARLVQGWSRVAGEKIAAHTKPLLSEKGELTVWVDAPALAQELGIRHKTTILKRAQTLLGKKEVKSVRFFVGQLR